MTSSLIEAKASVEEVSLEEDFCGGVHQTCDDAAPDLGNTTSCVALCPEPAAAGFIGVDFVSGTRKRSRATNISIYSLSIGRFFDCLVSRITLMFMASTDMNDNQMLWNSLRGLKARRC
jgi:hypothetical protein